MGPKPAASSNQERIKKVKTYSRPSINSFQCEDEWSESSKICQIAEKINAKWHKPD